MATMRATSELGSWQVYLIVFPFLGSDDDPRAPKEGKLSGSKWEDDEWDEWKEMCAERGTVLEVTNDL